MKKTSNEFDIIQVKDLSYVYKNSKGEEDGIHNISFQVKKGEFIAIVGPSGCGKTTLINLLCGIIEPDKGSILVEGQTVRAEEKKISVMFQKYSLLPWWNVQKNITFFIRKSDETVSRKDAHKMSDEMLKKVGMYESRHKYPSQLSGGMRQRGALARAFCTKSKILLLDEPFCALDVKNKYQAQEALSELYTKEGKTIIMVTHDINEAIYLADRIFCMDSSGIQGEYIVPFSRPRIRDEIVNTSEYNMLKCKLISMIC